MYKSRLQFKSSSQNTVLSSLPTISNLTSKYTKRILYSVFKITKLLLSTTVFLSDHVHNGLENVFVFI